MEQIVGSHVRDHVIDSDQDSLDRLLRRALAGSVRGEVTLQGGDGTLTPVGIGLSRMVLDGLPSVCMVVTDLTERKRAEVVLASEHFMRRLIDNAPIGVAVVGRDLRYLLANRAYQAIPGSAVVGRTIAEVFSPAVARIVQSSVEQALDSGQAVEFREYETAIRDRAWWNVSVIPLRNGADGAEAALILTQDVTERKQAERQLFDADQRLRALMEAVPVGVSFSDDPTCRQVTGNPAVLAQFEVTPEDNLSASASDAAAPGRRVQFFLDGRQITDAELPLQRAVAEDRVIPPIELEVRLPSGRRWFADASGAPVRDAQGRVVGGIAVTVDITERKRAEAALVQAKAEAEAANVAKGRFLANIEPRAPHAHERHPGHDRRGIKQTCEVRILNDGQAVEARVEGIATQGRAGRNGSAVRRSSPLAGGIAPMIWRPTTRQSRPREIPCHSISTKCCCGSAASWRFSGRWRDSSSAKDWTSYAKSGPPPPQAMRPPSSRRPTGSREHCSTWAPSPPPRPSRGSRPSATRAT